MLGEGASVAGTKGEAVELIGRGGDIVRCGGCGAGEGGLMMGEGAGAREAVGLIITGAGAEAGH